MKTILYIHGFNSAGTGSKAQSIAEHYKGQLHVLTPTFNYKDLKGTLRVLGSTMLTKRPQVVIGTSLGGYLALLASCKYGCKCVAVNPVTDPYTVLRPMLGELRNFVTKERYILREQDILPYKEHTAKEFAPLQPADEATRFLLSEADELLGDHHYLEARYPQCHHFQYFEGFDHRFNSLKPIFAAIDELSK